MLILATGLQPPCVQLTNALVNTNCKLSLTRWYVSNTCSSLPPLRRRTAPGRCLDEIPIRLFPPQVRYGSFDGTDAPVGVAPSTNKVVRQVRCFHESRYRPPSLPGDSGNWTRCRSVTGRWCHRSLRNCVRYAVPHPGSTGCDRYPSSIAQDIWSVKGQTPPPLADRSRGCVCSDGAWRSSSQRQ